MWKPRSLGCLWRGYQVPLHRTVTICSGGLSGSSFGAALKSWHRGVIYIFIWFGLQGVFVFFCEISNKLLVLKFHEEVNCKKKKKKSIAASLGGKKNLCIWEHVAYIPISAILWGWQQPYSEHELLSSTAPVPTPSLLLLVQVGRADRCWWGWFWTPWAQVVPVGKYFENHLCLEPFELLTLLCREAAVSFLLKNKFKFWLLGHSVTLINLLDCQYSPLFHLSGAGFLDEPKRNSESLALSLLMEWAPWEAN